MRGDPGDNVGDFLRRHRMARRIASPVRRALIAAAGDHGCPQGLVAHEREKSRIDNRSAFGPPVPSSPWQLAQYARKTVSPAFGSPKSALYGGRATPAKSCGRDQRCFDLIRQNRDLLIGQVPAGVLREGRHRGSRHTVCDDVSQFLLTDHGQKKRIVQRASCAQAAVVTVTTGAIALDKERRSLSPGPARCIAPT